VLGREDVGHRVVVRRIVDTRGEKPILSDLIGVLDEAGESHLTVRTADRIVQIPRSEITASKRIPDRRARSATERLELIAAQGWPAPDTDHLGDWLLRAAEGWTNRGNSALPVGDPGRPVPAAVDAVEAWYTARGLPPAITVPAPLGGRLTAELDRRGWTSSPPTLVQTAALGAGDEPGVRLDPAPSPAWLAVAAARKRSLPAAALHILSAPDQVRFAGVYDDTGAAIATARGVVTGGWLGMSLVEVAPDHRRQGHARRLYVALGAWATGLGASHAYLQVEAHNEAAVALYGTLGFRTHHSYVTRRPSA